MEQVPDPALGKVGGLFDEKAIPDWNEWSYKKKSMTENTFA
jgi:hypothetical protein